MDRVKPPVLSQHFASATKSVGCCSRSNERSSGHFHSWRRTMPIGAKLTGSREMEDALMYLPRKSVMDFRKGQTIFDENQPSRGLHLVVQGRVKVAIPLDDGCQT